MVGIDKFYTQVDFLPKTPPGSATIMENGKGNVKGRKRVGDSTRQTADKGKESFGV